MAEKTKAELEQDLDAAQDRIAELEQELETARAAGERDSDGVDRYADGNAKPNTRPTAPVPSFGMSEGERQDLQIHGRTNSPWNGEVLTRDDAPDGVDVDAPEDNGHAEAKEQARRDAAAAVEQRAADRAAARRDVDTPTADASTRDQGAAADGITTGDVEATRA